MPRRHFFGPVSATFADQNLRRRLDGGGCVVFHHDGPFAVSGFDTWESFAARWPSAWQPDFLVLQLQYNTIPAVLWQAPIPIVGLAGDWNLLWHHYRHVLPLCDLVLTDAPGVARFERAGIRHARPAQLFGCERAFVEFEYGLAARDIDILFVGNFNSAVQSKRLPWLGRIGKLKKRWNVHLTTNVFDDAYRALLGRARIVFNRSIRGECNNRTFETIAAGALLFQEAENEEVAKLLRDREEYVAYTDANLEELLDYYLEHEDERQQIAARAQRRKNEFTFEAFWDGILETIERTWPELEDRADKRREQSAVSGLRGRTWQQVSSTAGEDAVLVADLNEALAKQPRSAEFNHALGIALWHRSPPDLGRIAAAFQTAWQCDPRYVMAGVNLAEVLALNGQRENAIDQAQRVLAMFDAVPTLPADALDAVHVPTDYDAFRVEWERAAWEHAGDAQREEQAKRRLLRWRLFGLLHRLTGDAANALQHWSERPDLAESNATLATALVRLHRPIEALPYLRQAHAANPFDRSVAQALFDTYRVLARTPEQLRLADELQWLSQAGPALVPSQPWFDGFGVRRAEAIEQPSEPLRIVWHGAQAALHSLALVNRELCERLVRHGHEVSLVEPERPEPASRQAPLSDVLRARLGATLAGPTDVHVSHQWPPDLTPPAEGHWGIVQPWEYGSIPREWLTPMTELVDEVWVPSRFVRNCFIRSGVPAEQVHVVPNGVAPIFFEPHEPSPLATRKEFKFLFVGGTIPRKGIDLLLQAYQQCFSAADDVCLVIKDMGVGTFYQGQTAEQMIAALRARPRAPEIEYHAEEFSAEDMARLYAACDCLVHPYRAEGFGLPIAEALAAGLPVIVTGFGAALDFCDDDHAYLIPARAQHLQTQPGEMPTVDQQFWAQPDMDHLRLLLRHVVEHRDEARAKARRGRAFLRENYTWDHAAAAVETRLRVLRTRPIRRHQRVVPTAVATPDQRNGKPLVSLTMIVKNEEHNLADCLRSVADLVDEIVIADTGSTDRTKEIARQFGAIVVDFPWIDDFAAARNEALRHATGEWIFWMDADDRLDEDNRQKIRALFAGLPHGQLFGYNMKVSCLPGADQDAPTIVDHIRLFPNHPQIRWKYRIHEQILVAIRRFGGSVQWSDVVVQHVGYQDADVHRRKGDRNFRLLQLDYRDDPNDPYTLFNLGNMLHEHKRFDEAIDLLTRSLQRSYPTDSIVRKLYSLIAQCQQRLGNDDAALATCRDGRGFYPNDVELLIVESGVLHRLGDRAGAIACLQRLRSSYEEPHFGSVNTALRGHIAFNNLAVLFTEEGRFAEAEEQWRMALADAPKYVAAWLGLADLYVKQQRFPEVEGIIDRLREMPNARLDRFILQAQLLLARRQFDDARVILNKVIEQAPGSVFARLVLARAYLQEGRDWKAAEQALRAVLALDPQHAEARKNLAVLLNQNDAPSGEAQ